MIRAFLLLLSCGGCAFTTWEVQVPATPVGVRQSAAAEVVIREVSDKRPEKRVGVKKNGWGSITADVVATNDVAQALRESLAGSLQASGLQVVQQSARPWTIDAEIQQLVAEPDMGFWTMEIFCEARVRVQVASPDGGVYRRTFVGHASKGGIMIPDEGDYVTALHGALEDVLRQFMAALAELAGAGA